MLNESKAAPASEAKGKMLERLSPEWWLEELLARGWEYKKARLFEHYMGLVSNAFCVM